MLVRTFQHRRRLRIVASFGAAALGAGANADQPGYVWGRDWGGWNYDYAYDIARASDGGIVETGSFVGPADLDPTAGVDERQSVNQTYDLCVTKLNADGSYGWAVTIGGDMSDNGDAIAVDPRDGSIIVSGYFYSTVDFDPGPGEDLHSAGDDADAFILKLSRAGDFVWCRTIGASSFDEATDVGVDAQGNITYTGYFSKTVDFDPGNGTDFRTSPGDWDSYVSQLGPDGEYHWTHTFGGPLFGQPDFGLGIAVAPGGDILATGEYHGTADFDPGPGQDNRTSNGFEDIYVTRYMASGERAWTFTTGGPASERGWAVAFGPDGGAAVTGRFQGSFDFDPGQGVDKHSSRGESDLFVMSLGPDGAYRWTRTAGGTADYEDGRGVAVRADGSVVMAGWFRSPTVDFDPGDGVDSRASAGEIDAVLWQLGPGGEYLDTTTWGSAFHDRLYTVLLDGTSAAYVCGFFSETMDFDCGQGVDAHASDGAYDSLMMRLTLPGGCYADYNADGVLDLFDFLAFVNAFNAGDPGADCTGEGVGDLFDFLCFVNAFNAGC
jgi:hypothetical protein